MLSNKYKFYSLWFDPISRSTALKESTLTITSQMWYVVSVHLAINRVQTHNFSGDRQIVSVVVNPTTIQSRQPLREKTTYSACSIIDLKLGLLSCCHTHFRTKVLFNTEGLMVAVTCIINRII